VYIIPDCFYPFLHVLSSYSSPMGTDSSPPIPLPLACPTSSGVHNTLSIDGLANVNNLKIASPPVSSVTPAVVVHTPHPRTSSLQSDVPTLIEDMSTLQTHAYSRARIIEPGTYSRSVLRSSPLPKRPKLDCAGCTAVHSLGIDYCHKHDGDKSGNGPNKRLRR
jgi:hypothetical protein